MSNRTEGVGLPINIVTRIWPDAGQRWLLEAVVTLLGLSASSGF